MKTGFLKPLMLVLCLVSWAAQAQMYPVATFDTGEPETAGVDTTLKSAHGLNDEPAPPPSPLTPVSAPAEGVSAAAPAPMASAAMPQTSAGKPGLDSPARWQIRNGERLSDVFARWSQVVGWQTSWEPTDLVALADLELDDSYTGAIGKVVDALNRGGADIQVKFYAANHMLRIMARK